MALDTYSNLQTALAGWLNRTDLTSNIPDFVTLCEAQMNKELRTPQQVKRVQASITHEYEDLPTDYLAMLAIQILGSPPSSLEYSSPQNFDERVGDFSAGTPKFYTIVGSQLRFGPPPASGLTVEMSYFGPVPPLASNATNWLLTSHPEIYLYGSLIQSAPFLRDDPRVGTWQPFYTTGVESLDQSATAAAHAAGPLRSRSNIGRG